MAASIQCPYCPNLIAPMMVKKEGPNQGRVFYSCNSVENRGKCPVGFYSFEEDLDVKLAQAAARAQSSAGGLPVADNPAKRPRPAQSTSSSSSLPRQTQHVTKEMCDQATLGSIWTTLKQIEGRLVTMEQKQDFILARLRERDEQDYEPPASQAQ